MQDYVHKRIFRKGAVDALENFAALLVGGAAAANAAQYPLTDAEALMFGDIETITAFGEDTLPDLARRYSLGYEEIQRANPGVDIWLPGEGTTIVIPGQRLLPPGPREGIVVNLPEHRLYYFPKPKKGETPQVITYPGEHRQDGLEHAARQDAHRRQAQESDLDSAGVGAQGTCGTRRSAAAGGEGGS